MGHREKLRDAIGKLDDRSGLRWPGVTCVALSDGAEAVGLIVLSLPVTDAMVRSDDCPLLLADAIADAVLVLYPAWLNEAKGLEGADSNTEAALRAAADNAARGSNLFGPYLKAIALAGLRADSLCASATFAPATIIRESGKLLARAHGRSDPPVLLLDAIDGIEVGSIPAWESVVQFLSNQRSFRVWVVGEDVERLSRFPIAPDTLRPTVQPSLKPLMAKTAPKKLEAQSDPTGLLGRAAMRRDHLEIPSAAILHRPTPHVTPVSGRPHPHSDVEQRLEAHLAREPWASGRCWNAPWSDGPLGLQMRVDLMWPNEALVVELDGVDHTDWSKYCADRYRDRCLQKAGYMVVRFTNDEINGDIIRTVEEIRGFLGRLRNKHGGL